MRANNDGNERDAARYAAVYEAVCTGHYGGVGATCEFFDHYYDDHVDAVPAKAGPDGELGTADDVPAVPFVQGTHIGTTLVVTCAPGYDCDLDLTFVAAVPEKPEVPEVPAQPGPDGVLGTDDDVPAVPAVPAHYTATFTPTYVEPTESTPPRPVTARSSRASVISVSVTQREGQVLINGRRPAVKQHRPEPFELVGKANPGVDGSPNVVGSGIFVCSFSHIEYGHPSNPGLSHAALEVPMTNPDGTITMVIPDIHRDPATGRVLRRHVYIYPNARGECPLQGTGGDSATSTSADEYNDPGQLRGRVQTITPPSIANPEEPACMTAWRATKPDTEAAIRAWSNTYTDYCSDAELDAHDRAWDQWAADHDATFGTASVNQLDENGELEEGSYYSSETQPREGNEGTYEQQVEQLWERGEPYYQCLSHEEWQAQDQPATDRCQLVTP